LDADCAGRVTRNPWEPRPENYVANHTVPDGPVPWNTTWSLYWKGFVAKRSKVTGNFTGTTDEIIQWAACKWGIDEDVIRAVAVTESDWRQVFSGDYANGVYHSFGIVQIRDAENAHLPGSHTGFGGYRDTLEHTALAVDFYGAYLRACYEGDFYDGGPWLYGGRTVAQIAAAQGWDYVLWGCVGSWYSGGWYDAGAQTYNTKVKGIMAAKRWVDWGYPGK
jgi:hypothetical protein